MKYAVLIVAVASVFFFPYPLTVALSFAASLYVPVAGVLIGILADLLYYTPHAATWPVATIFGVLASAVALILRRFVRARLAL